MSSTLKKNIFFVFKLTFSVVAIYLIAKNVDWQVVSNHLSQASFGLLLFALVLNILERAELTLKWNILIKVKKVTIPFINLFNINLIGAFLGMFLPSSLGTDVVRGYYLTKNNSDKLSSFSSVLIDRILGVLSLILVGSLSLYMAKNLITNINPYLFILGGIIPFIVIYLLQKNSVISLIEKYARKISIDKISKLLLKIHSSIYDYKNFPKAITSSFILSILVQITRVLTYYVIAIAFGIQFPFVYFLLFIPIIMLVIMLPVSIGGLGLKEGTFIAFFSLVGMSVESATIISFTNTFVNTIITLFGGIIYLFYKPSKNQLESNNSN